MTYLQACETREHLKRLESEARRNMDMIHSARKFGPERRAAEEAHCKARFNLAAMNNRMFREFYREECLG